MQTFSILWRRLDQPGHESARVYFKNQCWHLAGTAVFAHVATAQPCRLDYIIVCNEQWHTQSARVAGWVGNQTIDIDLSVDPAQRWRLNGEECPTISGCIDLDLNFSPSTNLLPIRRLNLVIGQSATVRAAWLRFPSFNLEPLEQLYHRVDESTYHYESAGGRFVTDLQVNNAGLVTLYPKFWQADFA